MPHPRPVRKTGPLRDPEYHSLIPYYLVLSLLAFFPCLFLGRAYFDNDLLAQFGPWRCFLRDQLAHGRFPLWDPYLMGGQPFFADLQNMMFYPINYPTLLFPIPYGLGVFYAFHMFWAAMGMHLWLESLGLSPRACRTGALLFAFSGFFWLEIIHPPVLAAFSWLPWLFLAIEKRVQDPKPRHAFYAGFSFAMLFVCGSFQMTVGAFYGGLAYFLFRCLQRSSSFSTFDLRTFSLLTLFMAWGALPLLGQLIPTAQFAALSDRGSAPFEYGKLEPYLSLNPATLYEFLFPRLSLAPGLSMAEAVQDRDTASNFSAAWGYLGWGAPLLAYFAFRRKEKSLALFLGAMALLSLALCMGHYLPLHWFFYRYLPGFSMIRVPYRFLYLYVLPLTALAAMGFDEMTAHLGKTPPLSRLKVPFSLAVPLILLLLAAILVLGWPKQTWREGVGILAGWTGLAVILLVPKSREGGISLLQLGILLPLFLNGWRDYVPGPSSNFDFQKNPASIARIVQRAAAGRVIIDNHHLYYPIELEDRKFLLNYPQDASCALGLKNAWGYDPLMLQVRRDMTALPMETTMELGAIQGILSQQEAMDAPSFTKESFPPFFFYAYEGPLPWVFAVGSWEVLPEGGQRIAAMSKPDFDPYTTAILSQALPSEVTGQIGPGPRALDYRVEKDEPDEQLFEVEASQNDLVVFCDTLYPGWKAWVDGNPSALFTADHLLRALYVPSGKHHIEFRFEPVWWKPIQAGTALWLLLTGAGFLYRRKGKTHA